MKRNAWFINEPTKEQTNAMFWLVYNPRPWLGEKRKAKWEADKDKNWETILSTLDDVDGIVYIRRITQYSDAFIVYKMAEDE